MIALMRRPWRTGLCVAVLALTGCGGKGTYRVTGTVVFKDTGQPARELVNYVISLESKEKPVGARGLIRDDGTFELETFDHADGAVLGEHVVVITPPLPENPEQPRAKSILHPRYEDPRTSDLRLTVERKHNQITVPVERRP